MNLFPDILTCEHNNLFFKKVTLTDVEYIWKTAPLNNLFLVIGCEAHSPDDLTSLMQLDWTTWYLMLDNVGHSYGLIRAIPEIDNLISLHGIGWTQPERSPKTFVFSWYAFHYWLFQNSNNVIKTYCDFKNTNAIKFDLKTGYKYDYWMPAISQNSKIVHLKIEKKNLLDLLEKKQIYFNLKENTFNDVTIPFFKKEKAITCRANTASIKIEDLHIKSQLEQFIERNQVSSFYHYFQFIPRPRFYSFFLKKLKLGDLILTEIHGQKTIIIFTSTNMEFVISLEFVSELIRVFQIKTSDLILLEESLLNESLKNALTINFHFSGNHSVSNVKRWIA